MPVLFQNRKSMRKLVLTIAFILTLMLTGCEFYHSPDPGEFTTDSTATNTLYVEWYDDFSDEGQYWLPQQKIGTSYWTVVDATSNDNTYDDNSLRNHILAESITGLMALAVNEGTSTTMVWNDSPNSNYGNVIDQMGMTNKGNQTTWELLQKDEIRANVNGYVLCKMRKEESLNVAAVAAHVYRSIIVDDYYEDSIVALGYEMTYDARNKTTEDAWSEFKDQCNNNALVLMPTLTGNLKSFVIANRLMMVNYNKEYATTSKGSNRSIFREMLEWLEPLSPVIGWEQGIGEDAFVSPVSQSGNMMVPSDWIYNTTVMSANYVNNQSGIAYVTNPQYIDYSDSIDYVSFFLSDGDNVQWMMNNFDNGTYYQNVNNSKLKMSFGLPVANLSMMSPYQLDKLFSEQFPNNSIIEFGGGGYYYTDNFGENADRTTLLNGIAQKVGAHMRQHRVKVLGLFCQDVLSTDAQEAYQAYISNNNQLVGIIAVQYNPYAGGDGEIMWFENSDGIRIPVVTVKYAVWNHGGYNLSNQGTPTYIAGKLNDLSSNDDANYSLVVLHAWSGFTDVGDSDDPLAENIGGSTYGPEVLTWCKDKLNSNIKVVNVEELIWQLRMHNEPEQTERILSSYY